MSRLPDFIESAQSELISRTEAIEAELLIEIDEYLAQLETDDDGNIMPSKRNYEIVNTIEQRFDEMYNSMIPFLVWFGLKLLESARVVVSHFHDIGVKTSYKDVSFIEKQIGFNGTKIAKGSYLWNLGHMDEIRTAFHNYIIQGISSGQKLNKLLVNIRPMFLSSAGKPSLLSRFYRRYAYDAVAQLMNTLGNYIAKQHGLNKFLYEGGIVKDSRDFCVARAGQEFTREEGESWNGLTWRGKIPHVDFFVQCGGYNCLHSITWINE